MESHKESLGLVAEVSSWFEALLCATREGVIAVDPQGRVMGLNAAATSLTGLREDEVRGRPLADVLPAPYESVPVAGPNESPLGRLVMIRPQPERREPALDSTSLLAAGVGHQLNNALQIMVGHAELLSEGLPNGRARRAAADTIRRTGRRTSELVRKLIEHARARRGAAPTADLADLVADGIEKLRSALPQSIAITCAFPPDPVPVALPPAEFEQLLLQVARNAREAMPQGGSIHLRVYTVELDRTGAGAPMAVLAISDNGPGMDPEVRSKLFEPFFTTKPMAAGLGLTVVMEIVQRNGGLVQVDSELNRGTTFRFHFPRAGAQIEPRPRALPLPERHRVTRPRIQLPRGTETILVAEDEEAVLRLVEKELCSMGYTVLTAPSGEDALVIARAHQGQIDLLLTDVVMPGMDGLELGRRILAHRPSIRTIYMTGYLSEETAERVAREAGSGYLRKPFQIMALALKLRELLDDRPAAIAS